MSILKKPYEISVWEDVWDKDKNKFVEKRIAIIGTDQMLAQCRALEPNLSRNVNGVKKFSFKMYKKYIDTMTGEETTNPFTKYLISERKVKLKYDTYIDDNGEEQPRWYDFIVKDVSENSANYLCTYQLEDALVQELSKNGFNIVLDEKVRDENGLSNMGTIKELAEKTLAETDWEVASEIFVEKIEEGLVYVTLPANTQARQIEEQAVGYGITCEETITFNTNIRALAFYSSCTSKPHRFQFIVPADWSKIEVDENRVITNKNCQYFIEIDKPESGYFQVDNYFLPSGWSLVEMNDMEEIDGKKDTQVSTWYRGARIGFAADAEYVPAVDRYCTKYKKGDEDYFGFINNNYISPQLVQNVITNSEFKGTSGWTGSYTKGTPNNRKDAAVSVESVYGIFSGSSTGSDNTFTSIIDDLSSGAYNETKSYKTYLKIHLPMDAEVVNGSANKPHGSILINSGFYDNRTIIKNFSPKERWRFTVKVRYGEAGNGYIKDSNYSRPIGAYFDITKVLNLGLWEVEYNSSNDQYKLKKQYATFKEAKYTNNKLEGCFEFIDEKMSEEDFKKTEIKLVLSVREGSYKAESGYDYYLEEIELYKEVLKDEINAYLGYFKPGEIDAQGIIKKEYKFFSADLSGITEEKDILFDTQNTINYSDYRPQYNDDGNKVRAVSAKESNYFNILQSIAETFEAWLSLEIGRDNDGAINSKTVKFKNYAGNENYASFQYGVNLKDIQRTFASKNIVSKLIVKQNSNEHGENGFCTIQRADANLTGENYIYDFRYYQNQGLMDAEDYLLNNYHLDGAEGEDVSLWEDKSKMIHSDQTTNLKGYFPRIKKINETLEPINEEIIGLEKDLLKLRAEKEVQEGLRDAAKSELEELRGDFVAYTGVSPEKISTTKYTYYGKALPPKDGESEKAQGINILNKNKTWAHGAGFDASHDPKDPEVTYTIFIQPQTDTEETVTTCGGASYEKEWLSYDGSSITDAGLEININPDYQNDKLYQLSYMIENFNETDKEILTVGGHCASFCSRMILVSFYKDQNWLSQKAVISNKDSDESISVVISNIIPEGCNNIRVYQYGIFSETKEENAATKKLYIQPNKDKARSFKCKITNIVVKYGDLSSSPRTLKFQPIFHIGGTWDNPEIKQYPILSAQFKANKYITTYKHTIEIVDLNDNTVFSKLKEYATYQSQIRTSSLLLDGDPTDSNLPGINPSIKTKEGLLATAKNNQQKYLNYKLKLNKLFFSKYSRFIQEGTWIDEKYYDDNKYYLDAQSVMYNSCFPQVTYSINVLELSKLPGYELFKFELGDRTYVKDPHFFGSEKQEKIIITELSENLDDPSKNTIKVQNFKNQFQDLFQKITATVQQAHYSTGAYEKASTLAQASEKQKAAYLTDALAEMGESLSLGGTTNVEWNSGQGIILTDGATQNKLRLTGGAIMMYKEEEGKPKEWKTGITPEGISASIITTGTLNTGEVFIMNGQDYSFKWDTYGISAFGNSEYSGVISNSDLSSFVRFDKYGIYGIQNGGLDDSQVVDGGTWKPDSTKPFEDIDKKATFALTYEGLKVTGNDTNTALRIGKLDDYILKVTKGNTDTLKIDGAGNVSMKGHIEATSGKIGNVDITEVLSNNVSDVYSWKFSTSDGLYMWNGSQGNGKVVGDSGVTSNNDDDNLVFRVKDGQLWMRGNGVFTGDIIGSAFKSQNGTSLYLSPIPYEFTSSAAGANQYLVFKIGNNFAVKEDGVIYASGGEFTGKIIANDGDIGGWAIETTAISKQVYSSLSDTYNQAKVFMQAPNSNTENNIMTMNAFAVYARKVEGNSYENITNSNNLQFGVRYDGQVTCKNIIATGGKIGYWNIGDYTCEVEGNMWAGSGIYHLGDSGGRGKTIVSPGKIFFDSTDESEQIRFIFYSGDNDHNRQFVIRGATTGNNYAFDRDLSDERMKNSIECLSNKYEIFFDCIEPTRYKYNNGTSDRYHVGFIAQQLVASLNKSELSTQDFAGVMLRHPGQENECWYLRHNEFVALNTWQIQKLKPRVSTLEQTILDYETRISNLEAELQNLKKS